MRLSGVDATFAAGGKEGSSSSSLFRLTTSAGSGSENGLLLADRCAPAPASRWDADALYAAGPSPGRIYSRFFAAVGGDGSGPGSGDQSESDGADGGITHFDRALFGLPAAEAAAVDPHARLLLEHGAAALLAALSVAVASSSSSPSSSLSALTTGTRTATFVGCMYPSDFGAVLSRCGSSLSPAVATGNSGAFLAGRAAHALNLPGACVAVDTACSSSLVAAHLAATAMRDGSSSSSSSGSGSCTTALVAGVNGVLSPATAAAICALGAAAPDGRCKTLDAAADGYGRGEGFVAAVLALALLAKLRAPARKGKKVAARKSVR